ncbi:hypothetical protein [Streptomyces violascens]|uniref:hypothetical protein n=1 Tax=Streptomyces violascens TaxID=67381 RepID=UPI001677DF7A|nr:hypothetical protein [Streptomyces violascens]GGU41031.1 hypothetical protein GCM10010289_72420 [Streptomyces violascens]
MASRTRTIRKIATVSAAAALLVLSISAGTASASTPQPFASQARAAHLTPAQDSALRAEVAKYLQRSGGKQISLNEIRVDDKRTIRVAIPGEAHPRTFTDHGSTAPAYSSICNPNATTSNGYFCAFSGSHWTGSEDRMYYCHPYDMNFTGWGSWVERQYGDHAAKFYGKRGDLLGQTLGPVSAASDENWYYVWTVVPC